MVDPSTLRVGDRVLVEAVITKGVTPIRPNRPMIAVLNDLGSHAAEIWVPASRIHSILPRPLEVGDRVLTGPTDRPFEILAIRESYAWVKWADLAGGHAIWQLDHLTRIDPQPNGGDDE